MRWPEKVQILIPGGGAGGSTVTWMVNGTLQSELVLKELE